MSRSFEGFHRWWTPREFQDLTVINMRCTWYVERHKKHRRLNRSIYAAISDLRNTPSASCTIFNEFHGKCFSLIYSANANFAAGLMCTWSQERAKTHEKVSRDEATGIPASNFTWLWICFTMWQLRVECINGNLKLAEVAAAHKSIRTCFSVTGKCQFLSFFSRKAKTLRR